MHGKVNCRYRLARVYFHLSLTGIYMYNVYLYIYLYVYHSISTLSIPRISLSSHLICPRVMDL